MAQITVTKNNDKMDQKSTFSVVVSEDSDETTHTVLLDNEYYELLTDGSVSQEELITKSFEFLLEREPKESILSEFDLSIISRYFPEYEKTIISR